MHSNTKREFTITLLRLVPVVLGLAFSLIYSRLMGLEIRSQFTFILLSNALLSFLFMSGLCLHIRTNKTLDSYKYLVQNYLIISALFSFLTLCSLLLVIEFSGILYPEARSDLLPKNALYAIGLYSFFAALNMPITELLSTLQSLKAFVFTEILIVSLQIFIFLSLVFLGETSYFVSALISYSFSYALAFFGVLMVLISLDYLTLQPIATLKLLLNRSLMRNYGKSLVLNLIERFDKVLVPAFYSAPQLAQLTTFSSLLSVFRVIPDTGARLKQHAKLRFEVYSVPTRKLGSLLAPVTLLVALAAFSNGLIYFSLGAEWILPLPIIVAVTIYELLVWKSKNVVEQVESVRSRKQQSIVIVSIYFLFVLPLLMSRLSYSLALCCSIIVLLAWLRFMSYGQNRS